MPVRDKRSVCRSLFSPGSKKYWNLKTDEARLLFIVILTHADDFGRLEGAPEDVKSLIPRSKWTINDTTTYIGDLKKCDLIRHYKANKQWYIEVVNFWQNQDKHGVTQGTSLIPPPTNGVFEEHQDGVPGNKQQASMEWYSTIPSHTIPSHPKKEESEEETKSAWREFHKVWKAVTNRVPKPTDTNLKLFKTDCSQYGVARVLASIKPWAASQKENYLRGDKGAEWKFLKEGVHDYIDVVEKPQKSYPELRK